jgi:hypothetical protein
MAFCHSLFSRYQPKTGAIPTIINIFSGELIRQYNKATQNDRQGVQSKGFKRLYPVLCLIILTHPETVVIKKAMQLIEIISNIVFNIVYCSTN